MTQEVDTRRLGPKFMLACPIDNCRWKPTDYCHFPSKLTLLKDNSGYFHTDYYFICPVHEVKVE